MQHTAIACARGMVCVCVRMCVCQKYSHAHMCQKHCGNGSLVAGCWVVGTGRAAAPAGAAPPPHIGPVPGPVCGVGGAHMYVCCCSRLPPHGAWCVLRGMRYAVLCCWQHLAVMGKRLCACLCGRRLRVVAAAVGGRGCVVTPECVVEGRPPVGHPAARRMAGMGCAPLCSGDLAGIS
jgi:hypothetical protein